LDKTAPAGYSIIADQNAILPGDLPLETLTIANAEVGNRSITTDGGPEMITLDGPDNTILRQTQVIPDIDLLSLSDGQITFTVTLTDDTGNVGSKMTPTVSLQKTVTAPSLADLALQDTENWLPTI
jgi:hypothetical protein